MWEFFPRTGAYQLPCSEGVVSVTQSLKTGQLNVYMKTRGSGPAYYHPMVVADKEYVSRAVDFGWFRHVSGQ